MQIEPEEGNRVEVEVKGAMPNATFNVKFCPFANGLGGCFDVGSLATNNQGEGQLDVPFPMRGTFAGDFLLRRIQNQFVTGLKLPSNAEAEKEDEAEAEAEKESEGEDVFEVGLQPVAAVQGRLGASFTPVGNDPLNEGKVQVGGQGR